jgi:glycosyltransferase involved in cell wall biosynthesis
MKKRKIQERKKVLLVAQSFFPESVGGTEYYTLGLARGLVDHGWDVKIVTAARELTWKRYGIGRDTYEGITVIRINNPPEFSTKFEEYFVDDTVDRIFDEIVKTEKPDLVHFQHTAYLSSRLPEIVHRLNVPSVFTLHDYWYMCHRSKLLRPSGGICPGPSEGARCETCYDPARPNQAGVPRFPFLSKLIQTRIMRSLNPNALLSRELKQKLKKVFYRRVSAEGPGPGEADRYAPLPILPGISVHASRIRFMKRQLTFPEFVISPSVYLKKRYEAEGFREILYLPHGFAPQEKIANAPLHGSLVLAYLGNITPEKGADILIKELKFIRRRQNVKILFLGEIPDADYRERLETLAKGHPETEIIFRGGYGGREELKKILPGVHLVVFPSVWEENHPLVVGEALSFGVPVICSSLGGARETIEEGTNGLVFDPYSEGDLAARINLILEDAALLETLTTGAKNAKIERMETHMEKMIEIYLAAVKKSCH